MPAIPDYIRILTDARERPTDDHDALHARARRARSTGIVARLRRWTTQPRGTSNDGLPTPLLRDYPWHSPDRA